MQPTVTLTDAARAFLLASNIRGRLLEQELREQVDFCDTIELDYDTMVIGGYSIPTLIFTLRRADRPNAIVRHVAASDVLSRHPKDPNHLLFKGRNLIMGILRPAAAAEWGV